MLNMFSRSKPSHPNVIPGAFGATMKMQHFGVFGSLTARQERRHESHEVLEPSQSKRNWDGIIRRFPAIGIPLNHPFQ